MSSVQFSGGGGNGYQWETHVAGRSGSSQADSRQVGRQTDSQQPVDRQEGTRKSQATTGLIFGLRHDHRSALSETSQE